jgi:hypothetical protein
MVPERALFVTTLHDAPVTAPVPTNGPETNMILLSEDRGYTWGSISFKRTFAPRPRPPRNLPAVHSLTPGNGSRHGGSNASMPCIPKFENPLSSAFQPLWCLVFKGLVSKIDTSCLAAATADAIIGLHINRALLIFYGMHSTDSKGVAILTIMLANNVQHFFLLSTMEFRFVFFTTSQTSDETSMKGNKNETSPRSCRSLPGLIP